VLEKQATNGAILDCAGLDGRPLGVLPMKIDLQNREQARRAYYGAVFETKKKIPEKDYSPVREKQADGLRKPAV
jgi:hypothetical protein